LNDVLFRQVLRWLQQTPTENDDYRNLLMADFSYLSAVLLLITVVVLTIPILIHFGFRGPRLGAR